MLTALSIRDVVLVDALDLEVEGGLTVLTGETGAGKSILLDSLGLALGQRAESGMVRAGQAQASVTAVSRSGPGQAIRPGDSGSSAARISASAATRTAAPRARDNSSSAAMTTIAPSAIHSTSEGTSGVNAIP